MILYRALILLFSASWAIPAHAYLDPGTGSFLLQLLLGGVAGLVVIVKFYWHILVGKLLFWKKNKEEDGLDQDKG